VKGDSNIMLYLLLYVDGILIAGNCTNSINILKSNLKTEFNMVDQGNTNYFLGMRITQDKKEGTLKLDQKLYIENIIKRFNTENCHPIKTPNESKLKLSLNIGNPTTKPYCELVGCLMYLVTHTRPDISYAVNFVSRFQSNPSDVHWNYLQQILRYLKGMVKCGLTFS